jgi:uncharacterized OsmC-like protein
MKDLKFKAKYLATNMKLRGGKSVVKERHEQLKAHYDENPDSAMIVDSAEVKGENLHDPFRSSVLINDELNALVKTGLHRGVGGDHDFPNPGDVLCASLAACMEGTIRMIANRLEIQLNHTNVVVKAYVDVRGTLMFDKTVPVGFQRMTMDVELGSSEVSDKILATLFRAAKKSCVVYQTLKPSVEIENKLSVVEV